MQNLKKLVLSAFLMVAAVVFTLAGLEWVQIVGSGVRILGVLLLIMAPLCLLLSALVVTSREA